MSTILFDFGRLTTCANELHLHFSAQYKCSHYKFIIRHIRNMRQENRQNAAGFRKKKENYRNKILQIRT